MDGNRNIKFISQRKQLNRHETPLLKPDMMLITKDVMLPVKLSPPSEKLFSTAQIDTKKNLKVNRIQRLCSQSLKPLLKPEVSHQGYIERSSIDMHSKNSSFGMISCIVPTTKSTTPPYCLSRSNVLTKKSYTEKTQRRIPLAKEELNPRLDSRLFGRHKRDRSNINAPAALKIREADDPPSSLSEISCSSRSASLEIGSFSFSQGSEALGDSSPKLPNPNTIPNSGDETDASSFEQNEKLIISNDVDKRAESKIIGNIESESAGWELNSEEISTVIESIDESIVTNLDSRLDVCKSEGKHQDWIESSNLIATNKSDALRCSDTEEVIDEETTNNFWSLSGKRDQIRTEAAENDEDMDAQIIVDVECLLRVLVTNVSVLDLSHFDAEFERTNLQSTLPGSYSLDEERSGIDSIQRKPEMVELRYSLHDLPSSISPTEHFGRSFSDEKPIIDLETKYSWQHVDPDTPNVCNNFGIHLTRSNDQVETKYSWQKIQEKYEDLNDICDSEEELLKSNIDRNEFNIRNNSKLTCTEDLCSDEPKYQYSWQKLTSKYLVVDKKEDSSENRSQAARNIDVDIPINTETKSRKNSFHVKETFTRSSNVVNSNDNIEGNNKLDYDIGRIVVNSPLNHIISSMLPDFKVINRHVGFDESKRTYFGSNMRSESNNSSGPYSSMSSIKHIITSLNDMLKTQKKMLHSYVRDCGSDKVADLLPVESTPAPITVEKVEIFPSTLHVLGNYIVRDIRPEDMNSSKQLFGMKNDDTGSGQSLVNNLVNAACHNKVDKIPNKRIPEDNAVLRNALSNNHLTRLKNRSSCQIPMDLKNADFPSTMTYPIPFNSSSSYSSTFESNEHSTPKTSDLRKNYEAGSISSNEIEDGSLFPVLGYDSTPIDNWEPVTAKMEKPVASSLDSTPDQKGEDDAIGSLPYTKSVGLLKPRLQISFSEAKEAGDSNGREDELKTRLESATSRLKQCEQQIDANWNLDYSVLDDEQNISHENKEVQLPEQVEEHIKDIIKSAEEYLAKLEEQLKDLRTADDQIINSSERTLKDIDETYQLLMDNLCHEINKRRNLVRLETEVFKYEGLAPLRACKQEVDAQIRSTQHLIVLTETMLIHPSVYSKDRLGKIITATSHMGRIPAVPMPEELPYVTFSPPSEDVKKEIADRLSCLGCVLRMGPAQFTEVFERPACLQLKWQVVDPEFASEEQTFIVQKALGEILEPTSPTFETAYIGSEMSCFVKDLPVDHPITLRVGIQVSDTAWSVHRIAQTSIPAYGWDMSNSDYLITNSGRIATKVTQNISTLLSRGAQFSADYIIEFKFLEAASGNSEEGIGLVYEPIDATESLKRSGALLITPNGNIYIDGEEKLMQLPKMQLGTRIIFTSEQKDEDTLRMTIECANKAVTYDWTVQRPLHFAARFFEQNKWNFMVK